MRKAGLLAGLAAVVVAMMVAIPAVAQPADANNDNLPDRWEQRYNLPLDVNQAPRDQDRDGLANRGEFRNHMNPRRADTDGDGTQDRTECQHQGGQQGQPGLPPGGQQPPQGPVAP